MHLCVVFLLVGSVAGYYPWDEQEGNLLELPEQEVYLSEGDAAEDDLRIPGQSADQNDTYLCSGFYQPSDNFIVGFKPLADQHHIHHILIFGCEMPGVEYDVSAWKCGDMADKKESRFPQGNPCADNPSIIYAWAKGAPELDLPEGVAFPVGPSTKNRFLVLQVHYMHASQEPDFSGVRIRYTNVPQPRTAATLLMVTGGMVPPKSTESFESACVIDESVVMHPFAFRVHTHQWGKNVAGWIVNDDPANEQQKWTLIGQRDPQKEQLFEAVKNDSLLIQSGDIVAARCIISNTEDRVITMGPTGADEMCNFYMMYWVDGDRTLTQPTCYSPGAPKFHWKDVGLKNLPE